MTGGPLRIFIGYDPRELLAYHVLSHSILTRASGPVSITPVARHHLHREHTRERPANASTDFAFTRFLVPYLCDYKGFAVFMDCDMLVRCDIWDLWLHILAYPFKAVWCCQHDYVPKQTTKFLGHQQQAYPRKNWSSFLVFDCARCKALTPEYVNTASGLELHRFRWLDDEQIGSLPLDFNWLVGEYEPNPNARIYHWTNGGPWFPEYTGVDHAELWCAEYAAMRGVTAPQEITA